MDFAAATLLARFADLVLGEDGSLVMGWGAGAKLQLLNCCNGRFMKVINIFMRFMCTYMYLFIYFIFISSISLYTYMCMYINLHIYKYIQFVYIYIYMYLLIYLYNYYMIYIYIHTYCVYI